MKRVGQAVLAAGLFLLLLLAPAPVRDARAEDAAASVVRPVVITQPRPLSVGEGDTATFTVAAEGGDLSYQWYYLKPGVSGWNKVTRNGTSAVYSLTVALRHNEYIYYCKVTNSAGSVNSRSIMLSVVPRITGHPADADPVAGQTVTFQVSAAGTGLTYQWRYRAPGAASWIKAPGDCKGTTYTLTAGVEPYNKQGAYQIHCKVTNKAGNCTYSDTAWMNILFPPAIIGQPASVTAAEGKTASFTAEANGTGLSFQWYYLKPGETAWNRVKKNGTSATYTLTAELRHDGYTYRCRVTNAAGSVYSGTAKLTVTAKPVVTEQPVSVTAAEGGTASFTVAADGAGLSWQWYYKKPGETAWNRVKKNGTSATYTLTVEPRHDGYIYRCRVTNAAGSVYSSSAKLTVR